MACLSLFQLSCSKQPNLLLIITDDQGYGDLSLHGNTILDTPHLDAIGLNGVRFDNFHVSPVCAPTRAAVLTGRRPMSTGAYYVTRGGEVMDAGEYTLAELLKDHGYSTACIGKWHNGAHHPNHPLSQGFDEFFGFTAGHWNRYFDPELEDNGQMKVSEGYIADVFTDRAISYITQKKDHPFFCYLAYNTPHSPFQVPDQYYDMYIDRVTDRDSALRVMNASVYGMVKNIDDNVGRLMQTLRDLRLEENTIVLFMTDNGPNTRRFNGNMKGMKGWVNDGGVRVPCFIQWKGRIPSNKVVHASAAHIDLYPTLARLMGIRFQPVRQLHGVDLTGKIFGEDREEERVLFTHVNHGVEVRSLPGAVRTPQWRLTLREEDRVELTSRSDPGEIRNLADSLPELADSLKLLYVNWFRAFDSLTIPPIPVGAADSVVLPAHEGFLFGGARYFWSPNGWANDWVTGFDGQGSAIQWPLMVTEEAVYDCIIHYTSASGISRVRLDCPGFRLESELARFVPHREKSRNRIERAGEAIGQTWARSRIGEVPLGRGPVTLTISGTGDLLEIRSLSLVKR